MCLSTETVVGLLEGHLPEAERREALAHADGCDECRELLAAAARAQGLTQTTQDAPPSPSAPTAVDDETQALARGQELGRYLILGQLGVGGMSTVYAAYDPQLDRAVAIKVMRRGSDPRLHREAQALARLSHPNVVAIHDVGTHGGALFVAMEMVLGRTLRIWLQEGPRPWREIYDVFRQAGEGLAAAHAAGLIHRDFKPDNVLIGKDGRVRVADFGLARPEGLEAGPGWLGPPVADAELPASEDQVTLPGTVMGTPAYMSPEQSTGAPVDARGDQFSFACAMYEALAGARPFTAKPLDARVAEVETGRLAPPSPGHPFPRAFTPILARALSFEPEARFPDMQDLLGALRRAEGGARRGKVPWVVLGAAAVVSGLALWQASPDPRCVDARDRMATIWNLSRRAAVRQAFEGTGSRLAVISEDRTSAALDAFSARWQTAFRRVCGARRLVEPGDRPLEPAVRCLDQAAEHAGALVDLLLHADPALVESAPRAALDLPRPGECAGALSPGRAARPAADPKQLADLRRRLAAVTVASDLGRYQGAAKDAAPLVQDASRAGDSALEAESLIELARADAKLGAHAEAEASLHRAGELAARLRDDWLLATVFTRLVELEGTDLFKHEEARRWAAHAEAAMERAGDPPYLKATLLNAMGIEAYRQGKEQEAVAMLEQALQLFTTAMGPEHPSTARVQSALGVILGGQEGREEEALQRARRAVEIARVSFGRDHPSTAGLANNLTHALTVAGHDAEAVENATEVVAIYRRAYGDEHPSLGLALGVLGSSTARAGHPARGAELARQGAAMLEHTLGPNHPQVASVLGYRATALVQMGAYREAIPVLQRALEVVDGVKPPSAYHSAYLGALLMQAALEAGDADLARKTYPRVRTALDTAPSPLPPDVHARALLVLARLATDPAEAKRLREEAAAQRAKVKLAFDRNALDALTARLEKAP